MSCTATCPRARWPVGGWSLRPGRVRQCRDYLDRQLGVVLRERHQMRLYRRATGTSSRRGPARGRLERQASGAIVGTPRGWNADDRIVARGRGGWFDGLRRRACRRASAPAAQQIGAWSRASRGRAPITSLLVGSGEAGLTLRDSIYACCAPFLAPTIGSPRQPTRPPRAVCPGPPGDRAHRRSTSSSCMKTVPSKRCGRCWHWPATRSSPTSSRSIRPPFGRRRAEQRVSVRRAGGVVQRLRVTEQDASLAGSEVSDLSQGVEVRAYAERARSTPTP